MTAEKALNDMTTKNEPEKRLVGFVLTDGSKLYLEPSAIKQVEEYSGFTVLRYGHNPKTGEPAKEICVLSPVDVVIKCLSTCGVFISECNAPCGDIPPNQTTAEP